MKVGFIGLGRMGRPIVQRLLLARADVIATDVNAEAMRWAEENGVRWARSSAEIARVSDFVLSCVPGLAEVEAVMSGEEGLIAAGRPGAVVIDMSTIGFEQGQRLGHALSERGVMFLDAPLSGGEQRAAEGRLTAWSAARPKPNATQIDAISIWKSELKKPIVNSNQATIWACLNGLERKLGGHPGAPRSAPSESR